MSFSIRREATTRRIRFTLPTLQRADMVKFLRGLDTGNSSQEERPAAATINENQSAPPFATKTLPHFGFSLWSVCFILMIGLVGLKIRNMFWDYR